MRAKRATVAALLTYGVCGGRVAVEHREEHATDLSAWLAHLLAVLTLDPIASVQAKESLPKTPLPNCATSARNGRPRPSQSRPYSGTLLRSSNDWTLYDRTSKGW
jgi:hypothetical protein